jgi:hypothetical protein
MLLTSRKLLQRKLLDVESDLRGTLRNFGLKVGIVGGSRYEARLGPCLKAAPSGIHRNRSLKPLVPLHAHRRIRPNPALLEDARHFFANIDFFTRHGQNGMRKMLMTSS